MKHREIQIPKGIAEKLRVDVDKINAKLKAINEDRETRTREEILDDGRIVKDFDVYTKEELIALVLDASFTAGFVSYKFDLLIRSGAVDMDKFRQVMDRPSSEDLDDLENILGIPKDFL